MDRRGESIALVALGFGLACALFFLGSYQQQADMDPAVAMGMTGAWPSTQQTLGQSRGFMQPLIRGCPIAVVSGNRMLPVVHADATVKLGSDSGGLVFVPDSVSVKAGGTVQFVNNAGFPHNIIFDEDNVPEGVNAEKLSREDYLNAPGETHNVKFEKAGEYGYYCEPHQGAGMKGKITVN